MTEQEIRDLTAQIVKQTAEGITAVNRKGYDEELTGYAGTFETLAGRGDMGPWAMGLLLAAELLRKAVAGQ